MPDNSGFWVGPLDTPDTYELVTELGSGGEGRVWMAVLPLSESGRRVAAVKIMPEPADGDDATRWVRYGHLLSALSHPGLVRVTTAFIGAPMHRRGQAAAGDWPSCRYVVMDYVEGATLAEWINDNPDAAASARIAKLRDVASALDEIHSGRSTGIPVTHGDVKPDNIIVRPDGGSVLVDLGLTRLADAAGARGVSHRYAAPEVRGFATPATPASDAFSFAATVAHALSGKPPALNEDGGLDAEGVREQLQKSLATAHRPAVIDQIVTTLELAADDRPKQLAPWLKAVASTTSETTNPVPATSPPLLGSGPPPVRRLARSLLHQKTDGRRLTFAVAVLLLIGASWAAVGMARSSAGPTVDTKFEEKSATMTSTLTGLGEQASVLAIAPRSIDAADGHVVRWALSDKLSSNKQTMASFSYGRNGGVPVVGNWDTDLSDEVGLYLTDLNIFVFRDDWGGEALPAVHFGQAGDWPIVGDWDGDGLDDVGIYRPITGGFSLRSSRGAHPVTEFQFGAVNQRPIVGDWDGDKRDDVGVFDSATATFDRRGTEGAPLDPLIFGEPGDIPVAGDWDADGLTEVGTYRLGTRTFFAADQKGGLLAFVGYGTMDVEPIPMIGDWNGDGGDSQGVVQ